MAISRRQFLGRSGAVAGGVFGASLFGSPFTRHAMATTLANNNRFIVSFFLDGGNDGLNTLTPVNNGSGTLRDDYQVARNTGSGGIRLSDSELLVPGGPSLVDANTGAQLGFHPGLHGLSNLYAQGKVAVIQGCGYPNASLSHATSSNIWEHADPLRTNLTTGWLGRHLAANFGPTDIPALAVRSSIPGEFEQTTTSVLTVSRVERFNFPWDTSNGNGIDTEFRRNALLALGQEAIDDGQPNQSQIGAATRSTIEAAESYPGLHDLYEDERPTFDDAYDQLGTSSARDLREIAKVIYGIKSSVPNINARYFEVRNGGYDTHSDQGGGNSGNRHYDLHEEVGEALETFYADIEDMGCADDVLIFIWSEFSRRVLQNDTGTDHGTQGPMFVIGGGVNGGLYGNHPDIFKDNLNDGNSVYSQDAGNGFRATDFRDVYGTMLKHWVEIDESTILSNILPLDPGDPNLWWTAQNFDLGFLPAAP